MKIVSIAVLKGGAGKSTLAAALAVRAAQDGGRVAMIDLDYAQDSLGRWWALRGEPDNPVLVEDFADFMDERERLIDSSVDWLFLDTPPGAHDDLTELGISVSNAVVIPLRTSIFDFGSIADTVALCEKHEKPFRLLLNAVDLRQKAAPALEHALAFLASRRLPLCKTQIAYDEAWMLAGLKGRTGAEIRNRIAEEIDALWLEVQELVASEPVRRRRRPDG